MRGARVITLAGVLAVLEILANLFSGPPPHERAPAVTPTLALALLGMSTLLILLDTWLLGGIRGGRAAAEPRLQYSRRYQVGAFLLLVLGALLAVSVGVLTNLAASVYPTQG